MARNPVRYAVVDAFSDSAFKGNPAAVCLLEDQRPEDWLQSVATEFNISETCYLTPIDESESDHDSVSKFNLRWFTPVAEVKLCGHATMAAAHFCFWSGLVKGSMIEFSTLSGILTANKVLEAADCENEEGAQQFFIELNFPLVPLVDYNADAGLFVSKALGGISLIDLKITTTEEDLFVVLPSAEDITELKPNYEDIRKCPGRGLIISAPGPTGSQFDFISRFFCPEMGIDEDPVCGSAHCALAGYWSKRLDKLDFLAYAASPRGGIVKLHLDESNGRVRLQGKAITVMEGSLLV